MKRASIIVISSHVVRGTVGNRAAAFALETLGHPVWTVPTITLSWHPGQSAKAGPPTRLVAAPQDFSSLMKSLETAPWLPEVGGILSGYLGNAKQAQDVANLVVAARRQNPDLIYAADPVIGDGDRLYVPEEVARAVRDKLLLLANIVTPNPFELGWLTGTEPPITPHGVSALADKLRQVWNIDAVLATSAPAMLANHIGNLLVQEDDAHLAEHRVWDQVPNGLGDLTAALFLSNMVQSPGAGAENLRRVTSAVASVLKRHMATQSDELALEASTDELKRPSAPVSLRSLNGGLKLTPR